MPRCYGAYQTVWRRHKVWSEEGVWGKILAALQSKAYALGKLEIDTVTVDSTLIDSKKAVSPPDTMATRDVKA